MTSTIELPHERLVAYRVALDLLRQVQALHFADARLRDQVLRASKSVCLNIAEGVGRFSDGDRKRAYAIARGECCEVAAALDVASITADCDPLPLRAARDTAGRVYGLITGLIRRYDSETHGPKMEQVHEHGHEPDIELENENGHEQGSQAATNLSASGRISRCSRRGTT